MRKPSFRLDPVVLLRRAAGVLALLFCISFVVENSALAGSAALSDRDIAPGVGPVDAVLVVSGSRTDVSSATSGGWRVVQTGASTISRNDGDGPIPASGAQSNAVTLTWTTFSIMLTAILGIVSGLSVCSWKSRRLVARKVYEIGKNEQRLSGLLDIASDAVISVDQDQRITLFNRGATQIFGYETSEILGRPLDTLIPERFQAAHRQHIEEFSAAPGVSRLKNRRNEIVGLRRDGTEFSAEASISKVTLDAETTLTVMLRDITERKNRESALRRSEQRISDAIESLPLAFILYDAEGRAVMWNRLTLESMPWLRGKLAHGVRFEDLIRGAMAEEWFEEAVGREEEWLAERLEQFHNPKPEGREFARKDGRTTLALEHKTSDGGTVGLRMDITDRKRAREALRESEERLSQIFRTSPALIFVSEYKTGVMLDINPAALQALGYDYEEVVGKTSMELGIWPDESSRAKINEVLDRDGCVRNHESELCAKDGRRVPFLFSINRIEMDGKDCLLSMLVDITERKRSEHALKESQFQLLEAQRMAKIGFWRLDLVSGDLFWSDEIYRMFEIEPDAFRASYEAFLEAVHPDDRNLVDKAYQESLAERKPYEVVHRLQMSDGRVKWVQERCETDFNEEGNPVVSRGTVQDITEQTNYEDRLRQAQKMEAVGQLTGGIAHDFNNLLGVIVGNLDFVAESLKDDSSVLSFIREAKEAAYSGASLTGQLLAFSRKQSLSPEVIDLNDAVASVLQMLRRTLGETVEIRTVLGHGPNTVEVDPVQFEAMLLNLAVNARDALSGGGVITIETDKLRLDGRYAAERSYVTPGDYVMLSVRDTGTGMSPEVRAQVFEPFFTTKEVGKGSGLGLSMVFGFTKQSGGHIEVESEEGSGTTVKVFFPFKEGVPKASKRPGEDVSSAQGERVLVVEDNTGLRTVAAKQLGSLGFETYEAENGRVALDMVDNGLHVDLVLTDIVMPGGVSGLALATELAARKPATKVIYMTGYASGEMLRESPNSDDIPLLNKPFDRPELARAIQGVMGRRTPQGEAGLADE